MMRSLLVALLALGLMSCADMNKVVGGVASVAGASGLVPYGDYIGSAARASTAVAKTMEDITPSQEYYIGRTVSASIVSRYPVKDNPAANNYLNLLGQVLVMASEKPSTFKGYHFLLLDTDEVVAFAAPSGFVFVSKGMVKLCKNEDDLAAVLAHEIGHVQKSHALAAISTSRITSALTVIASEGAQQAVGGYVGELTRLFEGSIDDITQTLVNSGYARGQENEADAAAIKIMQRVGYDPNALIRVLETMKVKVQPGSTGFVSTHPAPDDRIADIRPLLPQTLLALAANANRDKRFGEMLKML
ncbi:M48 family metalloprotease [Methylobacter sp.]|uniref:M48 family metalloprotease n=1 Tax=Methylobacter sp. TaxID=2051955 RepID=UPI00121C7616|nr:M48 family metalloprotease [Methylobacter sp.]TAK63057.1 MAG: peptidase M48 [Methylobacter sp.]